MIKSIEFTEGFTVEDIYKDAPHKHEFTEGLNIYFGPNGAGKSVALRFMKAYCSIPNAGWTTYVDPKALAPLPFPHCYSAMTPDKDKAIVDWDGTPVFYNSGDIADNNAWFYQNSGGNSEDGLSTEAERFEEMFEKPSSGQYRLNKMNKLFQMLGNPPDLEPKDELMGGMFGDISDQIKYMESLPRDGRITVLLDEPERSISLPKQKKLLEVLLQFSDKFQIICACHSPFVLDLPREKVNLIEIQKDYVEECDALFNFGG
jgi:hypothetical protein